MRIATHILAEESLVEIVVTSGNGSVDGVKRRGAYQLHGLVEGEAALNVVAQTLKVAEGSVTLVAMVDVFLDAQLLEHEHTTDTEQDLLLQTVLPVATIERVGDGAVKLRVHLVVGVEQVELHTTNVNLPNVSMNLIVHVRHIHNNGVAVLIEHALDGQRVEVLCVIVGYLLSVHAERLLEVAVAIEEADGTHVDVAVRSLLYIVAGEHAETARIDLQHLVDSILHAEVGNRSTFLVGLNVHVGAEHLVNVLNALHDGLVLNDSFLALVAQTLKEQHGVASYLFVEFCVQTLPHVAGFIVPCPPHVVSNLVKTLQLFGKCRLDTNLLPLRSVRIIGFNFHILNFGYYTL